MKLIIAGFAFHLNEFSARLVPTLPSLQYIGYVLAKAMTLSTLPRQDSSTNLPKGHMAYIWCAREGYGVWVERELTISVQIEYFDGNC